MCLIIDILIGHGLYPEIPEAGKPGLYVRTQAMSAISWHLATKDLNITLTTNLLLKR